MQALKSVGKIIASLLGPLAAWLYTGDWRPFINANSGLERLGRKPLLSWLNYHQYHVLGVSTSFLGHRALKNPIDAWVYQEILFEVKPDVVLEIGNKHGGSTLYLAVLLEAMGHGRVLALDIDHSLFTPRHARIDQLTGDSTEADTIRRVHEYCAGKSVLIIHDAAHSRQAVLTDLRNYQDLVKAPGYLIVEDTFEGLRGFYRPDAPYLSFFRPNPDTPLLAVQDFLKENRRFVLDRTREKWILTSNPSGFLKCVSTD